MIHFIDLTHRAEDGKRNETQTAPIDGKFVQIRNEADEYIVFAPKDLCRYHSHIVEKFASQRSIEIRGNHKGDTVYFTDPMWTIVGGGKMRISRGDKSIEVGGVSQAYGPFETIGLKSKLTPSFEGYTIHIA